MRKYVFPALAALCLLALPPAVRAAEGRPAAPTVVVRLAPLDDLLADFRYLATLADREELVKQFEGLLKAKAGPKGLTGLDLKRPLGFYGTVGSQGFDSSGVLLLPVTDEKAFLGLLENLELKATKGKDGVYTLQLQNSLTPPVYFRFANEYAYVTLLNPAVIDRDNLLPPARVLPAGNGEAASVRVYLDRIPDNIKQLALEQLGLQLADMRDRRFGEGNAARKEFWKAAFEDVGGCARALVRDGRELLVRVNVDRKAQELAVEMTVDGKPGSRLATTITELGQRQSLFAGLLGKDAALQGLVRFSLPEEVRKALRPIVDDALGRDLEKETDRARREQAEQFLRTLRPTIESGDVDKVVVLRAPAEGSAHTLLVGVKVKDGDAIDKGFRDLVKSLSEGDRARIKLDAEQVGTVKVHRVDVQRDLDEKARRMLGDNPLYLAIRADAVLLALGGNGLGALREALAARPGAADPVRFEVALSRLAPAIAIDRRDDKGAVTKAAQEAFGQEPDADRLRLTVEGGQALKVRFGMKGGVLKFVSLLDRSEHAEK
jgi:hypothetical protein